MAWSLTMTARVLHLEIPAFITYLILGFIGASLLHRPLAAGTISVFGALVFMFVHIAIMVRMIWNVNQDAFSWGVFSIFVLPGIYPLMKRITYWPQAWLGLAMNCGVPMAWLALDLELSASALILYAGTWAWTIWYDKRDDVKAGVKSTALLFGTWIKPILFAFASVLVSSLYIAGSMNKMGAYYYLISVLG
ncbi:hypothetical protein H0H93_001895, partial [Arthromyces matolae]